MSWSGSVLKGMLPLLFERKQRVKKEYILLGVLAVVLLSAGLLIFQIVSEYRRADMGYEELKE